MARRAVADRPGVWYNRPKSRSGGEAVELVDVNNILLTEEELELCRAFARNSAGSQQDIEYGERTTRPRSRAEMARDDLIGKIAEVAFAKMMGENYGIPIQLDFNCYPRGAWDDQDAQVNGWRVDVKGTRSGGQWLLIEWNKLDFRQRENKLSHVYVLFTVGWDRTADQPTGTARYEGFVTLSRLGQGVLHTQVLPRGSRLPGKDLILQADNYGIRMEHLFRDPWDLRVLLAECRPSPRLTEGFKNPRTGQTTLELLAGQGTGGEEGPAWTT